VLSLQVSCSLAPDFTRKAWQRFGSRRSERAPWTSTRPSPSHLWDRMRESTWPWIIRTTGHWTKETAARAALERAARAALERAARAAPPERAAREALERAAQAAPPERAASVEEQDHQDRELPREQAGLPEREASRDRGDPVGHVFPLDTTKTKTAPTTHAMCARPLRTRRRGTPTSTRSVMRAKTSTLGCSRRSSGSLPGVPMRTVGTSTATQSS